MNKKCILAVLSLCATHCIFSADHTKKLIRTYDAKATVKLQDIFDLTNDANWAENASKMGGLIRWRQADPKMSHIHGAGCRCNNGKSLMGFAVKHDDHRFVKLLSTHNIDLRGEAAKLTKLIEDAKSVKMLERLAKYGLDITHQHFYSDYGSKKRLFYGDKHYEILVYLFNRGILSSRHNYGEMHNLFDSACAYTVEAITQKASILLWAGINLTDSAIATGETPIDRLKQEKPEYVPHILKAAEQVPMKKAVQMLKAQVLLLSVLPVKALSKLVLEFSGRPALSLDDLK